MIKSFESLELEKFFKDEKLPRKVGWASVKDVVRRKLTMLDAAMSLDDLKAPPGNKLKALKGNLAGSHSIRINDQWRVVFRWDKGVAGPSDVSVVDYH